VFDSAEAVQALVGLTMRQLYEVGSVKAGVAAIGSSGLSWN
jgi:hypothetical protein